jgi:N-acetylglucosamine-6-phosphate deacetylase
MRLVARDFRTARWIEIEVRGDRIAAVRPADGESGNTPEDLWVAPAFWDIQNNGRWGHSFSSPDLTVEQVAAIVREQARLGTARLCPTLISAPADHLLHGLSTIAVACDAFPDVATRVLGVHLEGPFLSELDGYRGAHPAGVMRNPDWGFFTELQAACGSRIVLVTLAPERPGTIEFIERATSSGVVVSLGHTAASTAAVKAAAVAGATLSTHLGNGIATPLPRHPNLIWVQAALDSLSASFIADGDHVDLDTLRALARAKGPDRTILVSDACPLAGLPSGAYGAWTVTDSGKIVVTGTEYLAGSNQPLETGLRTLLRATDWSLAHVLATVTTNPARLLRRRAPRLEAGELANIVTFRCNDADRFVLESTCVDGTWTADRPVPGPAAELRT